MKKIFTTLAFVLFTTSAFSYSCPMLWGEVDELLKTAKESGKTAATHIVSLRIICSRNVETQPEDR